MHVNNQSTNKNYRHVAIAHQYYPCFYRSLSLESGVLSSVISNHFQIYVLTKLKAPKTQPSYITVRSYKNYDPTAFSSLSLHGRKIGPSACYPFLPGIASGHISCKWQELVITLKKLTCRYLLFSCDFRVM
jgi:hypothetical protein